MSAVRLVLPVGPSVNKYWGHRHYTTFLTKEGRIYKELVKEYAVAAGVNTLMRDDVEITFVLYRSTSLEPDNICKALFDALQGAVIINDRQVVRFHGERFEDKEHPRVEVLISPMIGPIESRIPMLAPADKNPWDELPPADIRALKKSGMFWEMFPDAPK